MTADGGEVYTFLIRDAEGAPLVGLALLKTPIITIERGGQTYPVPGLLLGSKAARACAAALIDMADHADVETAAAQRPKKRKRATKGE